MHRPCNPAPKTRKRGLRNGLAQPPDPSRESKRKTRFKCPTIIQQARKRSLAKDRSLATIMMAFEFYRFRFRFRALDAVRLPAGKSANIVRGALGTVLREAVPAAVYRRLFEPG